MLDEELAFKLQAEEEKEERLAREKAQQIKEVNIAWDDVQARIEADYQLAQRLQAQEQQELTDEKRQDYFSKKAEAEIAYESSSKRAGTELEQESIKKQKVDEDKETAELQRLIEVVPDKEEVAIDAIPLATKPPSIVDYKGRFENPMEIEEYQVYGRIVGIKRLHDYLEVTATKVYVSTASVKLVLLVKIEQNTLSSYYCLYTVNDAGV
ncbi:hypothetical protein Tco_0476221 [Tanacetum coccineum]